MSEKNRRASPINGAVLPRGRPFEPGEQQREISRKAGKKSAQMKRERKTLREELLAVLTDMKIPEKSTGKEVPVQEALSVSLIRSALNGNVKAYEIIRDTIGEKPTESVTVLSANFSALDDAFNALQSASERGSSE